jgi:hypothetical protein
VVDTLILNNYLLSPDDEEMIIPFSNMELGIWVTGKQTMSSWSQQFRIMSGGTRQIPSWLITPNLRSGS